MSAPRAPYAPAALDRIEQRLYSYATHHADRFGFHFDEEAEEMIRDNSHQAAIRITKKAEEEEQPDKEELYIRQGEVVLGLVVERVVQRANLEAGYAGADDLGGTIDARLYWAALGVLCPCWPIC